MYVYVYVERERERDRKMHAYVYLNVCEDLCGWPSEQQSLISNFIVSLPRACSKAEAVIMSTKV